MHMRGRALDLTFTGLLKDEISDRLGKLFGSLWAMTESGAGTAAQANYWQLERGGVAILVKDEEVDDDNNDGIPDIAREADHLHLQDNP